MMLHDTSMPKDCALNHCAFYFSMTGTSTDFRSLPSYMMSKSVIHAVQSIPKSYSEFRLCGNLSTKLHEYTSSFLHKRIDSTSWWNGPWQIRHQVMWLCHTLSALWPSSNSPKCHRWESDTSHQASQPLLRLLLMLLWTGLPESQVQLCQDRGDVEVNSLLLSGQATGFAPYNGVKGLTFLIVRTV